jgi:hypothetical protein
VSHNVAEQMRGRPVGIIPIVGHRVRQLHQHTGLSARTDLFLRQGCPSLHYTNSACHRINSPITDKTFRIAMCAFITCEQSAIFVLELICLDKNRMLGKVVCFKVQNNAHVSVSVALLCSNTLVGGLWSIWGH